MVKLERFGSIPGMGTYGHLTIGSFECLTVEREWLDNKPGESCIPPGEYPFKLSTYYKGGYPAYEIFGVPNRNRILIHIANKPTDVQGCVGLGKHWGWIDGEWAVSSSREVFGCFMGAMGNVTEDTIKVYYQHACDPPLSFFGL